MAAPDWYLNHIKDTNPELLEFIAWMQNELFVNEPKKGYNWRKTNFADQETLLIELKKHVHKLEHAIYHKNETLIKEHLADNFCYLMFLAIANGYIKKPDIKK